MSTRNLPSVRIYNEYSYLAPLDKLQKAAVRAESWSGAVTAGNVGVTGLSLMYAVGFVFASSAATTLQVATSGFTNTDTFLTLTLPANGSMFVPLSKNIVGGQLYFRTSAAATITVVVLYAEA